MRSVDKFQMVRMAIEKEFGRGGAGKPKPKLLDVGCRDCVLKKHIGDLVEYTGVDLFQNAEGTVDYVQNFSDGVALPDGSFDIVVALDLVEHLEDMLSGMDELLRLTRNQLIILLPNMANIHFRKKFLFSGRLNAKYDISYGMGQDRHRWLTVIPQIDDFVREFSHQRKLTQVTERLVDTFKKRMFMKLACAIGMGPAWWAWASVYIIKKPATVHA